ncbi:hypothetical protein GWK47_026540 [Chionoecetes opilio]|uniref:Uncharacterized protein n=1 Tax=Chionoecetes opilio TaxID=41210 RepID=A0A8J8WCB2_CHIOP|nr:hypothetical protein GWK47_026540 [Chionoecetes opilio]
MPVFGSCGVETEGDDLVPDARFVHLLQDHCSHVSASRIRACRDPKKELDVIFPCEEDGDAVLRIAREGREKFSIPMQDQPLGYLLVPQFHDLLGGLLSPRNSLYRTVPVKFLSSPGKMAAVFASGNLWKAEVGSQSTQLFFLPFEVDKWCRISSARDGPDDRLATLETLEETTTDGRPAGPQVVRSEKVGFLEWRGRVAADYLSKLLLKAGDVEKNPGPESGVVVAVELQRRRPGMSVNMETPQAPAKKLCIIHQAVSDGDEHFDLNSWTNIAQVAAEELLSSSASRVPVEQPNEVP